MDVYLRWEGAYEERDVVAVFASLEAAQAAHPKDHDPEWEERGDRWFCRWGIDPIPPVPKDVTFETRSVPVIDGVATLPDGRTIASTAKFIDYPVLPEGYVADFGTPGRSCDFELERVTLTG